MIVMQFKIYWQGFSTFEMVVVDGVEREGRTSPQHCLALTSEREGQLIQRCDHDLEGRYWTRWLQWQTVRKWSIEKWGRKLTLSTRSGHMMAIFFLI